jgi:hypothetical protein
MRVTALCRVITTILLFGAFQAVKAEERADSIVTTVAEREPLKSNNWVAQLVENGFHINDPRINYSKFGRFCLNVYNWGDKTFNSYDPEYVVATGKNWKATAKTFNWGESCMLLFPGSTSVRMFSHLYSDLGASISFMAVSVGYTFNANELFRNPTNTRKNIDYSFTCARFAVDLNVTSTTGGMRITKFGNYNLSGHSFDFNDISMKTSRINAYYFFNHSKYSQAAAYCFSKYQLKSAGSLIVGLNFMKQKIDLDFSKLPEDMVKYLPGDYSRYNFYYTDYNVMCGYGYNWVLYPRRWLVNITAIPSVGYKHSYEDSTDGSKDLFATNLKAMFSVVYNHRSLFASLTGRLDGNVYYGDRYTFLNSMESLSLIVGARF